MALFRSFLTLTCIASASAAHQLHKHKGDVTQQTKKVSQRIALEVDAKGNIEDASKLTTHSDNVAEQVAKASVGQDKSKATTVAGKENEVKAQVSAGQVENSTDKANSTIVRVEAEQKQDSWKQQFMNKMDSWEHRLFAWKHNIVEKTEAETNSLWERIKSNATVEFPHELFPAEFLSTSCYETKSDCWETKPKDPPTCKSADAQFAAGGACRCSDHGDDLCNVNDLKQTMLSTGRCVDLRVYINKAGKKQEVHCAKMVKNKEWKAMGLVAQERDGPASTAMPWYKWCGFSYVSKDGECQRKQRFLTESCWGSDGQGACAGSDIAHAEFATSCYNGQCVPQSFVQTNVECSCSASGWRFPFVCSAEKDQCAGHPCMWNEKRGQMYCNFAEKQNWNDATRVVASVVVIGLTFSILTTILVMLWVLVPSEVKASIMYQLGMIKTV